MSSETLRPKPPQKICVCYHKTKFLSVITYYLTIKINPDNTVYANESDDIPPLPLMYF